MKDQGTVVVAMSGGVDSSVAAGLLVEAGYNVIGMMLRLWSEPGTENVNRCCTPDSMRHARRVAGQLQIPFYPVDVRQPFRDLVVDYFLTGYALGRTPNPCMVCNRHIRWGILRDQAFGMGADFLATGHYARLQRSADGRSMLCRAVDRHKDQSYILSVLSQEQLASALFPIGGYTKSAIRELAESMGFSVAQKPDSQDLCFIGNGDYRDFIRRHSPEPPREGPIQSTDGTVLGNHDGLSNYTIGQRKGLGLSSPVPLYVIDKNVNENVLVVGEKAKLGTRSMHATGANWIAGEPPDGPFSAAVQIRYRAPEAPATVTPLDETTFDVAFDESVAGVTPGQLAVIYKGEVCLGSGVIEFAGR